MEQCIYSSKHALSWDYIKVNDQIYASAGIPSEKVPVQHWMQGCVETWRCLFIEKMESFLPLLGIEAMSLSLKCCRCIMQEIRIIYGLLGSGKCDR
jgi:hypothetical protein